ncbi:ClbS/DfsB family four-helix bundle protein, partial [Burkholderia pseudomallei]|nr:ClbS/DfsB family four-helix bundle protein [Burkholderia pseudomallei]
AMPPGHARGTLISTANLAAYRLGGNRPVLKWCDAHAHGRPVEPPETGYRWNRTGAPRADVPCRLRRRRLLELAAPARERARARRRAGRAESRRIAVWRVRGQTAHARADDSARHVVPVCQRACAAAQVEAGRRARVKADRRTRSSAFVRVRPCSSALVRVRRRSCPGCDARFPPASAR